MADAGVALYANSRSWASIGIVQSIPQAPRLLALLGRLKRRLAASPPDVLVLVDFGAFNTRLGAWAVRRGIKTVYLMPPGSWRKDPNPKRMEALTRTAHLFLSPFPWNADNLARAGANAVHIGHPVLQLAQPSPRADDLGRKLRPEKGRLIALLPGSRRHEVEALAPKMVAVACRWPHPEDRFALVRAPSYTAAEFEAIVDNRLAPGIRRSEVDSLRRGESPRLSIVEGGNADSFWVSDAAVVCAGTATLEGAVAAKPMVVVYDGPWLMRLEWRLRRRRLGAPLVAMPNIIAGRMIVPELLGDESSVENIVSVAQSLLEQGDRARETEQLLRKVCGDLGPEGALDTAAKAIIEAGELT